MIHNLQKSAKETHFDKNISGMNADNVQGAIDELKGTIGYTMSYNLIPYPHYSTSFTQNGITWTDNGDGTVTANGTATGETTYFVRYRTGNPLPINEGKYILSGCASGGSASGYNLFIGNTVNGALNVLATDYGESADFTTEDTEIGIFIKINSGTKVNNLIFKPMINDARLGKIPFEPYVADVLTRLTNISYHTIDFDKNYVGGVALGTLIKKNGWGFAKLQFKITSNVKTDTMYTIATLPNEFLPFGSNNVFYMRDTGTNRTNDVFAEIFMQQSSNDLFLTVRNTPNTNRWYAVTFAYPLAND